MGETCWSRGLYWVGVGLVRGAEGNCFRDGDNDVGAGWTRK